MTRDVPGESLVELLSLIGTAIVSALFTVAGVLVEQATIHEVLVGQTVLGVWELGMGLIPLVIGLYLVGYQQLWPRLNSAAAE